MPVVKFPYTKQGELAAQQAVQGGGGQFVGGDPYGGPQPAPQVSPSYGSSGIQQVERRGQDNTLPGTNRAAMGNATIQGTSRTRPNPGGGSIPRSFNASRAPIAPNMPIAPIQSSIPGFGADYSTAAAFSRIPGVGAPGSVGQNWGRRGGGAHG